MRHLVQYVARTIAQNSPPRAILSGVQKQPTSRFICVQCRFQATILSPERSRLSPRVGAGFQERKGFSSSPHWTRGIEQDGKKDNYEEPRTNSTVHVVADEELPSHRERIRWRLSKQINKLMDDLMPKLALASQRINNYTGTDYSGIERLRNEIVEQGMVQSLTPYPGLRSLLSQRN